MSRKRSSTAKKDEKRRADLDNQKLIQFSKKKRSKTGGQKRGLQATDK